MGALIAKQQTKQIQQISYPISPLPPVADCCTSTHVCSFLRTWPGCDTYVSEHRCAPDTPSPDMAERIFFFFPFANAKDPLLKRHLVMIIKVFSCKRNSQFSVFSARPFRLRFYFSFKLVRYTKIILFKIFFFIMNNC